MQLPVLPTVRVFACGRKKEIYKEYNVISMEM